MDPESKQGGAGIRKRLRRERRRLVAGQALQDFAENTTLHGLRYITERGLSRTEKIFWIVSFVTSVSLCAVLVIKVWQKWEAFPILVTPTEYFVNVKQLPLPAVTICPHIKTKISVFSGDDYARLNRNYRDLVALGVFHHVNYSDFTPALTTKEKRRLEAIILLVGKWKLVTFPIETQYNGAEVVKAMFEMSPTLEDVIYDCELSQQPHLSCKELFKPVLTMDGVCFTMNTLAADEILRKDRIQGNYPYLSTSNQTKDWSYFRGYYNFNFSADVYPRRGGANSESRTVLSIILKQDSTNYSVVDPKPNIGYKVYLQHPADLPQSSAVQYSVPVNQSVSFGIKHNVMYSLDDLKDYMLPDKRACYFHEERQLKYFVAYTESNCELECLANYTLEACGCVWFHMPHDNASTICGLYMRQCFQNAMDQFDNGVISHGKICRCYSPCVEIQYEADIVESINYVNPSSGAAKYNYSRFELVFKSRRSMVMLRKELFTLTDFLAECGGLLGLFLGCSFLSIVEIAYFLTLRLGCRCRRDVQEADSTTAKNENQNRY